MTLVPGYRAHGRTSPRAEVGPACSLRGRDVLWYYSRGMRWNPSPSCQGNIVPREVAHETLCSNNAHVGMPEELLVTRCSCGHHALRSWSWTRCEGGAAGIVGNEHGEVSVMESQAAEARRENTFPRNVSPAPPPDKAYPMPADKGRTFRVQILFHRAGNRGRTGPGPIASSLSKF